MSARSDEYRRRTKEAEESARKATDRQARESFEEIARGWRDLADQLDRFAIK